MGGTEPIPRWVSPQRVFSERIRPLLRPTRTDGALVRLTTPIAPGEGDEAAAARRNDRLRETVVILPRFIPERVARGG